MRCVHARAVLPRVVCTRPLRLALTTDERGVVYLEFLLAFVPFFILFLCTAQLALVAQAALVVRHAALSAARQAVVSIDDDPAFYEGAPRKVLSEAGSNRTASAGPRVFSAASPDAASAASKVSAPEVPARAGDAGDWVRSGAA